METLHNKRMILPLLKTNQSFCILGEKKELFDAFMFYAKQTNKKTIVLCKDKSDIITLLPEYLNNEVSDFPDYSKTVVLVEETDLIYKKVDSVEYEIKLMVKIKDLVMVVEPDLLILDNFNCINSLFYFYDKQALFLKEENDFIELKGFNKNQEHKENNKLINNKLKINQNLFQYFIINKNKSKNTSNMEEEKEISKTFKYTDQVEKDKKNLSKRLETKDSKIYSDKLEDKTKNLEVLSKKIEKIEINTKQSGYSFLESLNKIKMEYAEYEPANKIREASKNNRRNEYSNNFERKKSFDKKYNNYKSNERKSNYEHKSTNNDNKKINLNISEKRHDKLIYKQEETIQPININTNSNPKKSLVYDVSSILTQYKKKHTFIKSDSLLDELIKHIDRRMSIILFTSNDKNFSYLHNQVIDTLKVNKIRMYRNKKDFSLSINYKMQEKYQLIINLGVLTLDEYKYRSSLGDDVLTILPNKDGMEEVANYLYQKNEELPDWLIASEEEVEEEIDDADLWN